MSNWRELCESVTGPVLWLTGAGISAESGIPTFRGEEGYWRIGSRNYQPMELATYSAFCQMPEEVWSWYLYRRSVCRSAEPNGAHRAIAACGRALGKRQLLITQNVDGLHLRAGSEPSATYEIHGNIDYARPVDGGRRVPLPKGLVPWPKERRFAQAERDALCGAVPLRPHVLWFDESYDEANFRFESSLRAAASAAILVVVGTTGATNLPLHIGRLCAERRVPILVVNPEPNPFCEMAAAHGVFLEGTAGEWVPKIATALGA